jgi:formylglycine-generating enzyme required for sulfatase activity
VKDLDTSQFPVEQVSYEDAIKFCEKLSGLKEERKCGRLYRLPSEAEWEYCCRGGARLNTFFHFGNSLSSDQANFDGSYPYGGAAKGDNLRRTSRVGSYRPNVFGLNDMHGNVWEWCADWYDKNYYANSLLRDPPGPSEGSSRVIRGGSWYNNNAKICSASNRSRSEPGERSILVGFRVLAVPTGK